MGVGAGSVNPHVQVFGDSQDRAHYSYWTNNIHSPDVQYELRSSELL